MPTGEYVLGKIYFQIASGEGRNAVWLASRGWTVTAVDFSQVGLDKAEQLASEHGVDIATVQADATAWQPDGPVDLVVLSYLQLPADQQRTVLKHAATWLAPDGTLFVIAHDRSNVERGHGGPPSADVCYTVDDTVAALDGLDVVVADVVERPVHDEERPWPVGLQKASTPPGEPRSAQSRRLHLDGEHTVRLFDDEVHLRARLASPVPDRPPPGQPLAQLGVHEPFEAGSPVRRVR